MGNDDNMHVLKQALFFMKFLFFNLVSLVVSQLAISERSIHFVLSLSITGLNRQDALTPGALYIYLSPC